MKFYNKHFKITFYYFKLHYGTSRYEKTLKHDKVSLKFSKQQCTKTLLSLGTSFKFEGKI